MRYQRPFVLAAVFVTGAAALILEVAGQRLLAPAYGTSVYVWSAVVSATLLSLSVGYLAGGAAADRACIEALFAADLTLAALAMAAVPAARHAVFAATTPLDIRWGALLAAVALLSPSLFLLGALNPMAVRLLEDGSAGRRAGRVYALSTLGGVAGALAAGFALIPRLPIPAILYGVAAALCALAAAAWRRPAGTGACLAGGAAALALALAPSRALAPGSILALESPYAQLRVVDSGRFRFLLVDGVSSSFIEKDHPSHGRYLSWTLWPKSLRPAARTGLVIGAGVGALTRQLQERYGLAVDSVEIDPALAPVARSFFGFPDAGAVFEDDGRRFLERNRRLYSVIVVDAFRGGSLPYHLFTREAFLSMKRSLEDGGIAAFNLPAFGSSGGKDARALAGILRTLSGVFRHERVFLSDDEDFILASDGPLEGPMAAAPDSKGRRRARELDAPALAASGALLTDDRSALDVLSAELDLRSRAWRNAHDPAALSFLD